MDGKLNLSKGENIMKKSIILSALFIAFMFISCGEDNLMQPYGPNDGIAPGEVTLLSYEAIPGGISIKYKAPEDVDLFYIKAKYMLDTGKEMEARASVYGNGLTIQGFGNVDPKKITLSAVDRFENEGKSSTYEVIPGQPSYSEAFKTIDASATFGGVAIKLENAGRGDIVVDVLTQDSIGEWYSVHTEYTRRGSIQFAVRGFDPEEREFRVSVRDPWGNTSGEYSTVVTPYFEKQLDRSKFREFYLPTDTSVNEWGFTMSQIWNGNIAYNGFNMCHSNNFENFPVWFTFDMGVKAKLSHYTYWQRLQDDFLYQHNNPKEWELWGHADTPPLDGSWDGWVLLCRSESFKPSGLPVGQISQEDIEYSTRGEDFEFPLDAPPVRYIRFKALSTFTGNKAIHFAQIWFYGQEVED